GEDDALCLELLVQGVIDDLRLVLRRHAGEELPLRLRHPQAVEGVLDVGRDIVPGLALLLGRLQVVIDVLEVDHRQVGAPGGHFLLVPDLERFQPEGRHPLRLVLHPGNLFDDLGAQATLGLEDELLRVEEAVLLLVVVADVDPRDDGCHYFASRAAGAFAGSLTHSEYPFASSQSASSAPPERTNSPFTRTWT